MARIARVVVPGIPHHITQRGNRRMETFFSEADYREYLFLMAEWANRCKVQVWAYCLMPNHVHLVVVPESEDGLGRAIGEAHRRYTRYVNFQKGWKGHLWQGRFASFPMDEQHLIAAVRYIELNPVKAGLTKRPEDYRWSSAKAHLQGEDDILVKAGPLLSIIPDWKGLLSSDVSEKEYETIRHHERSGRPLGNDDFLMRLEKLTARILRKQKPGPRKNS
ncbi:MAG: transposase [Deltaproteobacteria bacterium]|nr:transposase [Deltaproteobacteria bacterium]